MATSLHSVEELENLVAELQESNEYLEHSKGQNRLLMEQNRLLQLKLDSATAAHGRRDEEVQLRDWGNPNKFEVRSPMSYELPATTVEKTGEMDEAEFPSRLYREVQPQGTLTSRQHLHSETSEYNLRGSTTRADQEEKRVE